MMQQGNVNGGPAHAQTGRGPAPLHPQVRHGAWLNRDLLLGLGVLGLAAFFFIGALRIRISPSYAHIGPRFFPFLVSTGLGACGIGLLAQGLRQLKSGAAPAEGEAAEPPINWVSVSLTAAAVVFYILLLERAGFIAASTVLFSLVAAAFGARRYGLAVLIGFILSFTAYWAFTQWLGLRLPAGIMRPILLWLGGS
ncbi:MAG: tripartite tricarboxylate transporter TctB family protein [Bacillota bacterium]|nr:MAG: tripartite tricarboxylate transporter TctB family protein [Bacillota bacterium]